jgi:hypothetical protein
MIALAKKQRLRPATHEDAALSHLVTLVLSTMSLPTTRDQPMTRLN